MPHSLNIPLLEPYYGGSHKLFCDTLAAHSRHRIRLLTMPARKWKWRMRGAAIWFTREQTDWLQDEPIDALLCTDMLAVADLRAMLPPRLRNVPIACYFHENQLTYPLQPGETRDLQYGMTNITSCLAADAVYFNSEFHKNDFLRAADDLLRQMPDHVTAQTIDEIAAKATVLPPPIDVCGTGFQPVHGSLCGTGFQPVDDNQPPCGTGFQPVIPPRQPAPPSPIIVWCHRWEYDKNPEPFFAALLSLSAERLPFQLVMLGEQFREAPPAFHAIYEKLKSRIVHRGFVESRADYLTLLRRCDIVVSTAIQEFCGLAVIEAMLSGCQPLLPNRLAYPELIPPDLRPLCLYESDDALEDVLRRCLQGLRRLRTDQREMLAANLHQRFAAPTAAARIDDALSHLVNLTRNQTCSLGSH